MCAMQKKKCKVWKRLKSFLIGFGFPLAIILLLIGWGFLTGWWNMAAISIILVLCISVLFWRKAKRIRDAIIVLILMIPILERKIKALENFADTLEEETIFAVAQLNEVPDIVRDEQLFRGIDGEGRMVRPPYTKKTIQIKLQKRQPVDRVTLRDTGDFYDSLFVLYGDKEFFIVASDPKRAKLQSKYGKDILGMNETSRDILAQKIKPVMIGELRKKVVM